MLRELAIVVSTISALAASNLYAQNATTGARPVSSWSNNQNPDASTGFYYDPEVGRRQMEEEDRREGLGSDGRFHPVPTNNAPVTGTVHATGIH